MVFRLNLRLLFAVIAALGFSAMIVGCGGGNRAPADPPAGGIVATPGEGNITITWNATPGVEYWLVYAASPSISATPTPTVNHVWAQAVTSPFVITGLTNGVTYSFAMNGRTGSGAGGPSTPSVSAIPRPAGGTWTLDSTTAGAQMASTDPMTGLAFDGNASFVSVSSSGAIYNGAADTTSGIIWAAASAPVGYNFNAVAYMNATDGFVAAGAGGYCRGTNMALPNCTATSETWNAVASNGGQTVMVGNGGKILHADSVGGPWQSGSGATGNLNGVAYVGTNWIAVGDAGAIFKSADGNAWSAVALSGGPVGALKGLASYGGTFAIAVGADGTVVTSTDAGLTWTAQPAIDGAPALNAVNASYNQILAVANGGKVFTSALLSTPVWTPVSSASTKTTKNLTAVFGSSSQYIAVGSAGTSIYSK
jgi:hypothetical protein